MLSVSRKSEYRIRIVLSGLTIRIRNTKYQIVYNILEKIKLKYRYLSHTRYFVLKICETIRTGIWSIYSNIRMLFGCQKTQIPNSKYYSVMRKSEYRIRILQFVPTIRIVFEDRIICHTLIHSTLYSILIHYKTWTKHPTLYTIHYTIYTTHYKLYTIHCKLYTTNYTLYTLNFKLNTIHYTPFLSVLVLIGAAICIGREIHCLPYAGLYPMRWLTLPTGSQDPPGKSFIWLSSGRQSSSIWGYLYVLADNAHCHMGIFIVNIWSQGTTGWSISHWWPYLNAPTWIISG